jgi:hypothetical protein
LCDDREISKNLVSYRILLSQKEINYTKFMCSKETEGGNSYLIYPLENILPLTVFIVSLILFFWGSMATFSLGNRRKPPNLENVVGNQ